jgi:hypothetical protein
MAVLRKSPCSSEIAQEGFEKGQQQGIEQGHRDVALEAESLASIESHTPLNGAGAAPLAA